MKSKSARRRLWTVFLILFFFCQQMLSQSPAEMTKAREYEREAGKSYESKNFAAFLENTQKANELRPNHPRILYNLADAYAVNGKADEALKILEKLSNMGLYYNFEKDDDFKSLFALERFKTVQQKTNLNKQPVNLSLRAFSIPEKDLITEGIAYNPRTKTFFVGSIHQRKILSIDPAGTVRDFSGAADELWSVSGMKVDEKRQVLWVTSSAFPQMRGFQKADDGKAGVFKYDLKTGRLLKKYLLSNEAQKHALGDLTVTREGRVFATDSVSNIIYFIDEQKDRLEVFLESPFFFSLQGLALSPDEQNLFVADYSVGIFRIDTKTRQVTPLRASKDMALLGIDGLYFHDGKLLAIQNGISPNRVIEFRITSSAITDYKILEANHPDFNEPTLGVIDGRNFYYVANSQWGLVNEKGELNAEKLSSPVILRLPLSK